MSNALLLTKLAKSIGNRSAKLEFKWMKQALVDHHQLPSMVNRRLRGEPLQYILGSQPFGPLSLLTRPPVLIPRPETEDWVYKVAKEIERLTPSRPLRLLDLCTGSGCIPLLLCRLLTEGSITAQGIDISRDAVELAKENAIRCGTLLVENDEDARQKSTIPRRNTFSLSQKDILDRSFSSRFRTGEHDRYDILTSNPPYIPRSQYDSPDFPASVREYEDPRALLGDLPGSETTDGLTFYREIAKLVGTGELLKKGGKVFLEVGEGQAGEVERLMRDEAGLNETGVWKDPWGKDRVVFGRA